MTTPFTDSLIDVLHERAQRLNDLTPIGSAQFLDVLAVHVRKQTGRGGTSLVHQGLERVAGDREFVPGPASEAKLRELAAWPDFRNPAEAFAQLANVILSELASTPAPRADAKSPAGRSRHRAKTVARN